MNSIRPFLIGVVLLGCLNGFAQTHFGISLNVGNRQKYYPDSKGFGTGLAPSGSLFVYQKWTIKKVWTIFAGTTTGVVGYNVKVIGADTITNTSLAAPFTDYSTIFLSLDILPGRQFFIGNHSLVIGAGGGVTGFASLTPTLSTSVGIANTDNNDVTLLYKGYMTAPANTISAFWKAATYYEINAHFKVGMEYVHHAKHFAEGTYEFYHTETPQAGTIKVYQREFRLVFSYNLQNGQWP